jgi:hypothetical protein
MVLANPRIEVLSLAERLGFDIFLTMDKGVETYRQVERLGG